MKAIQPARAEQSELDDKAAENLAAKIDLKLLDYSGGYLTHEQIGG